MRILPLLACLACVALATAARGDVLTHKDGRRIEGTVTSEKDGQIRIKTEFGEFSFARADILAIERGKTRWQEFEEREKKAKSAEEFFQLAEWARGKGMAKETKRCLLRVVELEPMHEAARRALGHVLYKSEWMTPAERDKRAEADLIADRVARGLVEYQGRFVTPEEKAHLERDEVEVDGKWIPFADAQRAKGLESFEGKWLPRAEALARADAAVALKLAGVRFQTLVSNDVMLCGPQTPAELEAIAASMRLGRAWFDAKFRSTPGLEIFGGRLAEFYMFDEDAPYLATCDHFASLTPTAPPGWAEAVKNTYGFMWWDPYPLSSARRWRRAPEDLAGHDLHHYGHLLVNRLGYDGRLLPPWFDEGVAGLVEFNSHGRNAVFCKGHKGVPSPPPVGPSTGGTPPKPGGTRVKTAPVTTKFLTIDDSALRDGNWKLALSQNQAEVPPFDRLASLQFDEMQSADIAASMGIVGWLETRGEGALRAFHDVLRKRAPRSPVRVLPTTIERELVYDEAFKAASGLGWRDADRAWREWIAQN